MSRSSISLALPAAIALLAPPTLLAQAGTGRIKANVVDETGRAVPQAVVRYHHIPSGGRDERGRFQETPGQTHLTAQASVEVTGAFATPPVPLGTYILCVDAAGYLSSCKWSGWHTAILNGGADYDLGRVVLKKAATVTVRINDPLHLLPKDANSLGFSLGVLDEGNSLHSPEQATVDSTGRTLQISVPYGRPLQLWVHGGKFDLTGAYSMPLSTVGNRNPFQAAVGALTPVFTINVVGLHAP